MVQPVLIEAPLGGPQEGAGAGEVGRGGRTRPGGAPGRRFQESSSSKWERGKGVADNAASKWEREPRGQDRPPPQWDRDGRGADRPGAQEESSSRRRVMPEGLAPERACEYGLPIYKANQEAPCFSNPVCIV